MFLGPPCLAGYVPFSLCLVMPSLYRLQQCLAITGTEATALLFIAGLLLSGLCVRYVQGQSVPYSAEHYAALDADFDARAAPLRAEASSSEQAAADSTREEAVPAETAPVVAASTSPRSRQSKPGPVRMNLNTASERLLQRLPGIGPALAGRIIAYRNQYGDFAQPGHLVRVKGIGPKTFEKLEPYLFVEETEGDQ